jgi:hypothetical protein
MIQAFTDTEAAVEEAHFIQHALHENAYLALDRGHKLYVLTARDMERPANCKFTVIETFYFKGSMDYEAKKYFKDYSSRNEES